MIFFPDDVCDAELLDIWLSSMIPDRLDVLPSYGHAEAAAISGFVVRSCEEVRIMVVLLLLLQILTSPPLEELYMLLFCPGTKAGD